MLEKVDDDDDAHAPTSSKIASVNWRSNASCPAYANIVCCPGNQGSEVAGSGLVAEN